MHLHSYTDANSHGIPKAQGIYAFFADLVSPSKIGLAGAGPWTLETLSLAKGALLRRVAKQQAVLHSTEMSGILAESKPGPLRTAYAMTGRKQVQFHQDVEIGDLPLERVREYAQLLQDTCVFTQPLYVGITYEQTLFERYNQHRGAYMSSSGTGFGGRLRDLEIEWDDLLFLCHPLAHPSSHEASLRIAERHLHSLTHPVCSLR